MYNVSPLNPWAEIQLDWNTILVFKWNTVLAEKYLVNLGPDLQYKVINMSLKYIFLCI